MFDDGSSKKRIKNMDLILAKLCKKQMVSSRDFDDIDKSNISRLLKKCVELEILEQIRVNENKNSSHDRRIRYHYKLTDNLKTEFDQKTENPYTNKLFELRSCVRDLLIKHYEQLSKNKSQLNKKDKMNRTDVLYLMALEAYFYAYELIKERNGISYDELSNFMKGFLKERYKEYSNYFRRTIDVVIEILGSEEYYNSEIINNSLHKSLYEQSLFHFCTINDLKDSQDMFIKTIMDKIQKNET